jgi:hypothetical protein
MVDMGHSLQVRPRPLVHKCPLCINTDRKFWALGFVAKCQEATYAVQQENASFDHLVGALLEKPRHFEAKRLSSLEIDHQLEPSRLHNRQVSRFSAFKNPASVDAHLSVSIGDVCSVADQAAGKSETYEIDRRLAPNGSPRAL